jgi:hypothetical protein
VLQRQPEEHEYEHFRHLQSLGIGSHSLLASLLTSPEAIARRQEGGQTGSAAPAARAAADAAPSAGPAARAPASTGPSMDGTARVQVDDELLNVSFCLGLFDTCPCDATALRVAQT